MSDFRASRKPDPRPKDWDNAVRAAHIRLTGGTYQEAGVAGMVKRAHCAAVAEDGLVADASRPRFDSVVEMARISFMKGVGSDRNLAFKLLERVDPKLAPPAVVYRRERDFWKDIAGMTPEEQLRIEEMTDEVAIGFLHSRGIN